MIIRDHDYVGAKHSQAIYNKYLNEYRWNALPLPSTNRISIHNPTHALMKWVKLRVKHSFEQFINYLNLCQRNALPLLPAYRISIDYTTHAISMECFAPILFKLLF